jgi:hypothetical protein
MSASKTLAAKPASTMRRPLLLALALLTSSAWALDFKGLVIGEKTTAAKVEEVLGGGVSIVRCGVGANEMQVCNGVTTIADAVATVNAVLMKDGTLARVMFTFDPDDFDAVTRQMRIKYGAPQSERSEAMQNGFGAKFTQTRAVWDDRRGNRIDAARFAGKTTETAVVRFSSPADPYRAPPPKDKKPDM